MSRWGKFQKRYRITFSDGSTVEHDYTRLGYKEAKEICERNGYKIEEIQPQYNGGTTREAGGR